MARPSVKVGDTYPALKFSVTDQRGELVDFTAAAGTITMYARGDPGTIDGPMEPIDPPEEGLDENRRTIFLNIAYPLARDDTRADAAGDYVAEIVTEWDADGVQVETFPGGEDGQSRFFEFSIVANNR